MKSYNRDNSALVWLTLGYFLLLVYASLMPYDFSSRINASWVLNRALHAWPVNPYARVSGSDVLSNLLLYIPLGALMATSLRKKGAGKWSAFSMTFALCFCTSLGVETLQIFSLSRTSSITDLLMNTISGITGAGFGVVCGMPLWRRINLELRSRCRYSPLDLLTLIFAGLLAADAMAPFMPTLLLSQIGRSVKASEFNVIAGFSHHPWHWWLVTHILVYMVFTLLSAQWRRRDKTRMGVYRAAFICSLFALVLEAGKIFIASRVMNLSNLAANLSGILLAVLILHSSATCLTQKTRLNLGILGTVTYILYLGLVPFDFHFNTSLLVQKLPRGVELLPLYHYAMGASLNHVRLFVQTVLLSVTFVYFVRLRFDIRDKTSSNVMLAVILAGLLGVIQEGGQLFLLSRTASMTDIYSYMLGGALSMWVPLFDTHNAGLSPKEN
ncbi:MAG: VanZ family protein [Desulfuromonadaceae bacterium]|nr:VanZ family protein [Desulfuromonadaceae bacterium]